MARLVGPVSGPQLAYQIRSDNALLTAGTLTATVYSDAAGTLLADILTYPAGTPIVGSQLTVPSTSLLPLFQFPNGTDTVYVSINGGPVTPVYAKGSTSNVTYRGAWAAATAYSINDLITYAGGAFLVNTAFTSGSAFGLANLTNLDSQTGVFNVLWYGAQGDGITDDTVAINAAVTAAYNNATSTGTNYAEVYFPPLNYKVSGSLTQGGATKGNALIPLPVVATTAQKVTLVFRGGQDASGLWYFQQTTPQSSGGATLVTTVTGTNDGTFGEASVIGGPTPAQGYGRITPLFSNMIFVIQGIKIVNPNNPFICGVDLAGVAECHVRNLAVQSNATPSTVTAPSAQTWQFGLRMPDNNNNALCTIGTYTAQGQYVGVYGNEHTVANVITCVYCVAGIEQGRGGDTAHGSIVDMATLESCQVGLGFVGGGNTTKIDIRLLDWEGGSGGFAGFAVVNDPSNVAIGDVGVTAVGVGTHLQAGNGGFHINGATGMRVMDRTRFSGTVAAPAVPASTVALRNPFFRDAIVVVTGGTVSAVSVDGVAQGYAATGFTVIVPTGKNITLTYSSAPTWVWTLL